MQTLTRPGEESPFWARFGAHTLKAAPSDVPPPSAAERASPPGIAKGGATGASTWMGSTPFYFSPITSSPSLSSPAASSRGASSLPRSLGGAEHSPSTPPLAPFEFMSKATSALRSASFRATRALSELKGDLVGDLKAPSPPHSSSNSHTKPLSAGWTLPWARPVKTQEDRQREETQRRVQELSREPWLFLVPSPSGDGREGLKAAGFQEEEDLMAAAEAAMEEDPCLRSLFEELVPRMVPGGAFWRRYFSAVRAIELDVFRFFDAATAHHALATPPPHPYQPQHRNQQHSQQQQQQHQQQQQQQQQHKQQQDQNQHKRQQHQQQPEQYHSSCQQPQTPPLLPSSPWTSFGYTPGTPQSSVISGYSAASSTLSSTGSFEAENEEVDREAPNTDDFKTNTSMGSGNGSTSANRRSSSTCAADAAGGCNGAGPGRSVAHSRLMGSRCGELSPFSLLPGGSTGKSAFLPMSPLSLSGKGIGGDSPPKPRHANPGSRKNIFPGEASPLSRGTPLCPSHSQADASDAGAASPTKVVGAWGAFTGQQRSASESERHTPSSLVLLTGGEVSTPPVPRSLSFTSLLQRSPRTRPTCPHTELACPHTDIKCPYTELSWPPTGVRYPETELICPLENGASSVDAIERADNHSSGSGTSSSSSSAGSSTGSSNGSSVSTTATNSSSSSCCSRCSTSGRSSSGSNSSGASASADATTVVPLQGGPAPCSAPTAPHIVTPPAPQLDCASTSSRLSQTQSQLLQWRRRALARPLPSTSALLRLSAAGASALGFGSCQEFLTKHRLVSGSASGAGAGAGAGNRGAPAANPTVCAQRSPHSSPTSTPASSLILSVPSLFPPNITPQSNVQLAGQAVAGVAPFPLSVASSPSLPPSPSPSPSLSQSPGASPGRESVAEAAARAGACSASTGAAASDAFLGQGIIGAPPTAPAIELALKALFAPTAQANPASPSDLTGWQGDRLAAATGWQGEPGLTRALHGAPEGSLVADMALVVASLSSVQEVAYLWLRFVDILRMRFQRGEPIPRVPHTPRGGTPRGGPPAAAGGEVGASSAPSAGGCEGREGVGAGHEEVEGSWGEGAHPDLQACEILQHLQLLNLCMARRERHRRRLEAATSARGAVGRPRETGIGPEYHLLESEEGPKRAQICSDAPITNITPACTGAERRGVLHVAPGVFLLRTGEPLCVPVTQETPLMTETSMRETEELVMRTRSMGAGCKQLFSDMQAFKAANPGCILHDFVRWYSPPDWSALPYNVLRSTPVEADPRSRLCSESPLSAQAEAHDDRGPEEDGGEAGDDTRAAPLSAADAGAAVGGTRRALFQVGSEGPLSEGPFREKPVGEEPVNEGPQGSREGPVSEKPVHEGPVTEDPESEGPAGARGSGYLSVRMTTPGNLWQELWGRAQAVPSLDQPPLYDVEQGGETALLWLHDLPPSDLLEQLFVTLVAVGLSGAQEAVAAPQAPSPRQGEWGAPEAAAPPHAQSPWEGEAPQAGSPGQGKSPAVVHRTKGEGEVAQCHQCVEASEQCPMGQGKGLLPGCAQRRKREEEDAEVLLGPLRECVEECVRYATAVCCRGMGPMKQRLVASVYRILEAAREAACADLAKGVPSADLPLP